MFTMCIKQIQGQQHSSTAYKFSEYKTTWVLAVKYQDKDARRWNLHKQAYHKIKLAILIIFLPYKNKFSDIAWCNGNWNEFVSETDSLADIQIHIDWWSVGCEAFITRPL